MEGSCEPLVEREPREELYRFLSGSYTLHEA